MTASAEELERWRQDLLLPLEPFGAPPASGRSVGPHPGLAAALQYAAALGPATKGPKELVKWSARFGYLADEGSAELVQSLSDIQSSVLTRRDQVWRDWLSIAAASVPAENLTAILGERRAGRFQEDVAAALAKARRLDALPELVRLAGSGSEKLPVIVGRFVRALDDPFAVFCVQVGLVPPSSDSAEQEVAAKRHRELVAAAASMKSGGEAPAANGDPGAVLAVLALPRGELTPFVSSLSPEALQWLFTLVPSLRTRLGEGGDPRPGTPDHELRSRLYALVMATPQIPMPRRLETQAATAVRNELRVARPAEVSTILGAVDAGRRSTLLRRSLDADDQTFDLERARGVIGWLRVSAPTPEEVGLLRRATSTLGSHLQELAVDLFLAHAVHFPQIGEPLLGPLGDALTQLPPTARDALVRDLLPAFDVVATQLAPRLDSATRAQLVRSAGVDAHPYALSLAELALTAQKRVNWAELDVLLEVLGTEQLEVLARLLGDRLDGIHARTLDVELRNLGQPDRISLLLAAPAAVLPRVAGRHPGRVGAFLRELEAITSASAQSALWGALVEEGAVNLKLLRAFVDAGGVPPDACAVLPIELAAELDSHLAERCEHLVHRTEALEEQRAAQVEGTWQLVREGVATAVRESADLLVGTGWSAAPIRALGRALRGGGVLDVVSAAPDHEEGADAEVLPFQTALLEAIGALDEYGEELEAAVELEGVLQDDWDDDNLAGLAALLRLLDARGWGERANSHVSALRESAFADPGLLHGFRALVARVASGDSGVEMVSRLSQHLQALVVRRAFGDDVDWLASLTVSIERDGWFAWMQQELGIGEGGVNTQVPDTGDLDAWREVQARAENHRRRQRGEQRAATGLERTTTDVLRRAAEELRASMDEVEVVLRAYSGLRQRLTEIGLGPAVGLVELTRGQADLDLGVVRLAGAPRESVELLTGGFAQPDGPVLVPASGVPRGRAVGGND